MKNAFIIGMMMVLGTPAFAGGQSADNNIGGTAVKLLANARVLSVQCNNSLEHKGHDFSEAGVATVMTEDRKTVVMRIVVSRMSDETKEANALCGNLKAAARSKEAVDVIYDEREEATPQGWELRLDIKGAVKLYGLS